jgi:hypothetical protein
MKTLILLTASSLALGLAGCAPGGKPAVRAALDCPDRQGDLTRTGMAADRKSCTYRTGDGNVVTLQLVATNGDAAGTLKALETSLTAAVPGAEKAALERAAAEKAAEPAKVAETGRSTDAERVAKEAAADAAKAPGAKEVASRDGDDVNVHLPGLHVEAHDGGGGSSDRAHIDLPGIHINADGDTDQADIKVGSVTVNAKDDVATIRVFREVRLRGEALSREKRGLRATFIYTGKNLSNGYRFVGYEAGGPKAGPLTVAILRSNLDGDMHDRAYNDVKRLVRKNGGV